jgi:uncharacterized protein
MWWIMFRKIWRNREGGIRLTWKLAGIILMLLALSSGALLVLATAALIGGVPPERIEARLIEWGLWIQQPVMLGVVALFAFVFDRFGLADFGLKGRRDGLRQFFFGLFLGAALISLAFVMLYAAGWLSSGGYAWRGAPFSAVGGALLYGALLFALVGISEEFFFRGYFLQNHTGSRLHAVLVSAFFFAALHLINPHLRVLGLVNIAAAGILFAYMYLWSGSLYMPAGAHISWNFVMGDIFNFPVSGLARRGLLDVAVTGPEWLTGGEFGLEGGLIATLLLAAGLLASRAYLRRLGYRCSFGGRTHEFGGHHT